jgi:hypothetical protein
VSLAGRHPRSCQALVYQRIRTLDCTLCGKHLKKIRFAIKDSYAYSYHFWMGAGLSKMLRDGETLPKHEIAFADRLHKAYLEQPGDDRAAGIEAFILRAVEIEV